jgi:Pyruvate/2-oxoacid:ferredoxin oxidoreductase gamma subunit
MAKVHEITIWTRGVTMDKEGRDIATAIGDAAHKEGKHVQFFDNYEDLPDRVLVTTRKYVRISDEEIEFIPNADILGAVATLDADAISGIKTVDFSGSEGGVDAAGVGGGMAAAMAGAFARVSGMVKKETLAKIVKDVAGMEKGYEQVKLRKFRKARAEYFWGG